MTGGSSISLEPDGAKSSIQTFASENVIIHLSIKCTMGQGLAKLLFNFTFLFKNHIRVDSLSRSLFST